MLTLCIIPPLIIFLRRTKYTCAVIYFTTRTSDASKYSGIIHIGEMNVFEKSHQDRLCLIVWICRKQKHW